MKPFWTNDTMPLADYLARGGKLTSPNNVPPRYRAELLRLMSSFVDSELAGSAGFADAINWAPGLKERIAASRITLEKVDHAEQVLDLMSDFGTDKALYNKAHSWSARQPRDAQVDAKRQGGDMRLSVFHYPLQGWTDAVVMNFLMGLATVHQLKDLSAKPLTSHLEKCSARSCRGNSVTWNSAWRGFRFWLPTRQRAMKRCRLLPIGCPRFLKQFGPAKSAAV